MRCLKGVSPNSIWSWRAKCSACSDRPTSAIVRIVHTAVVLSPHKCHSLTQQLNKESGWIINNRHIWQRLWLVCKSGVKKVNFSRKVAHKSIITRMKRTPASVDSEVISANPFWLVTHSNRTPLSALFYSQWSDCCCIYNWPAINASSGRLVITNGSRSTESPLWSWRHWREVYLVDGIDWHVMFF